MILSQIIGKQFLIDRLNFSGDLKLVVQAVCSVYTIGSLQKFSIIEVGYEDCNVVVETEKGKFLAKIFSKKRTQEDVLRYTGIMEKVLEAGVRHPQLFKTKNGDTVYQYPEASGLWLVLMQFIEGKTFLDNDKIPDAQERQSILKEAARINLLPYHPAYVFDSWAIPNIRVLFEKIKSFVDANDRILIEKVLTSYESIPLEVLPKCFVHGDLTKANIIKSETGDLFILDFSVANWYPRVQELAVLCANLLSNPKGKSSLRVICKVVAEEYSMLNPLTPEECVYLYPYALAGMAMELMGAYQEKFVNGNDTAETAYWLRLGREGLVNEVQ